MHPPPNPKLSCSRFSMRPLISLTCIQSCHLPLGVTHTSQGSVAWSSPRGNLSQALTPDRALLRPQAPCVSVTTLWSKVAVAAVDTTPLPNNCQSPARGLESLSQGPGGASCHNFAQGVGLSFGKLWSCERVPNPAPRPISSRDECRRSQGDEKRPAQAVKVYIISS